MDFSVLTNYWSVVLERSVRVAREVVSNDVAYVSVKLESTVFILVQYKAEFVALD